MIHAKTMLIDDRLVMVGSMNLDFLSMQWLEEGCLVVDDHAFAQEFEQRWEEDMARSLQVTGREPHPRREVRRPGSGAAAAAAMTP